MKALFLISLFTLSLINCPAQDVSQFLSEADKVVREAQNRLNRESTTLQNLKERLDYMVIAIKENRYKNLKDRNTRNASYHNNLTASYAGFSYVKQQEINERLYHIKLGSRWVGNN
ncbi:MAG: hypothetical protein AAF206_24365, partial [Bacteroidota bacterium]